jgi:osmotically-inducible protein OsmY
MRRIHDNRKEKAIMPTKPKLSTLRTDIEESLKQLAELDMKNIEIEIEGNRVILRGKVRSLLEREMAEAAAQSSPGVFEVENRIAFWH